MFCEANRVEICVIIQNNCYDLCDLRDFENFHARINKGSKKYQYKKIEKNKLHYNTLLF